jgi:hypothetical protein
MFALSSSRHALFFRETSDLRPLDQAVALAIVACSDRHLGDAARWVWAARSGTLLTLPMSVIERVNDCAAATPGVM